MSRYIIISLLLFALVVGVALVVAEPSQPAAYTLQQHVISGTAGQLLQGNDYQMVSTSGESASGSMSGTGYAANSGFVHETIPSSQQQIFLPIITR